jgi:NitT/TauT family transport system substrate-binding protein
MVEESRTSGITRRELIETSAAIGAAVAICGVPAIAQGALDAVTFGTNWKAQAEHGGYYQAVATGIYRDHGLDVTVRAGGPQVNHSQLLLAGAIDFNMGGSCFGALNFVAENLPFLVVGTAFQKDPQVLIAHPGQGNDSLADLVGKPILISADARTTYWVFLKARYGYTDAQIRPYTFNMGPFLADPSAIQQGYVTSEPFAIRQAGLDPVVMLLADSGYNTYSTTIETSRRLVDEKPDLVQRFVDATALGWYSYLYGDPEPGNVLIKKDNPEMTDAQIAYSIEAMREYGIVDSGDSETMGIGAMTDARWQSFFDLLVAEGAYPADLAVGDAYTLGFVNKGVGLDLKRQLTGG